MKGKEKSCLLSILFPVYNKNSSELSFSLTSLFIQIKEFSLFYYLPIAGGRTDMPFLRSLASSETYEPRRGFERGSPIPFTTGITDILDTSWSAYVRIHRTNLNPTKFRSNTNNSIKYQSFVRTELNSFKHCYLILVILIIKYSYVI